MTARSSSLKLSAERELGDHPEGCCTAVEFGGDVSNGGDNLEVAVERLPCGDGLWPRGREPLVEIRFDGH